jgi:hypothetical protein
VRHLEVTARRTVGVFRFAASVCPRCYGATKMRDFPDGMLFDTAEAVEAARAQLRQWLVGLWGRPPRESIHERAMRARAHERAERLQAAEVARRQAEQAAQRDAFAAEHGGPPTVGMAVVLRTAVRARPAGTPGQITKIGRTRVTVTFADGALLFSPWHLAMLRPVEAPAEATR